MIRVLAVVGLLTFGLSVMVILMDVANPVANERALEPAGSPEAELGADRSGEAVHVVGALAALLVGGSGVVALVHRPERLGSANHTIAAMLGSIIAMGIVGNPNNRGGQAGAFDPAFPLTFMIVLVTATAAISATGWSLAVVTPALAAIALGAASLVAPAAASALTPVWASLTVAWGITVLALGRRVWRSTARPT